MNNQQTDRNEQQQQQPNDQSTQRNQDQNLQTPTSETTRGSELQDNVGKQGETEKTETETGTEEKNLDPQKKPDTKY